MSIEAMKQALEALEFIRRWGEPDEGILKRDDAIIAIREALASPVDTNDTSQKRVDEPSKQRHEQEPVAWVERDGELVWNNREAAIGRNLYTTPPQRTWVDLTDEEVAKLANHELWVKTFIRKIEEKLRSKNT